ncbi:MAG TPA: metalloregulator ArsR/SmtB family transcription factor [Archaeoglobaceae archaeon]|nr:metalloregulator ArsR/SmtB family transcription factor [Archaeoglobaceae archaeon]
MVENLTEEILEMLGNESRRRILNLLSKKPCYVSEISYSLKMAPKVVLDHLDKLEKLGIVSSYEEGRRRYYSINRNLRVEISITPHRFIASTVSETPELEIDEFIKNMENLLKTPAGSLREIYKALQEFEEVERQFSEILGAVSLKFNEMFERFLTEIEKEVEDELERLVLLGITKGADTPFKISEEYGISYMGVIKALKSLENRNIVEKLENEDVWRIKC